jgi:hypothetical protein
MLYAGLAYIEGFADDECEEEIDDEMPDPIDS